MSATTFERPASARHDGEDPIDEAGIQLARAGAIAQAELRDFIADVEDLVKKVAHVADADVTRIRARLESSLDNARKAVGLGARSLSDRTRAAAAATDDYVRERPWTAMGVAAAIGAVIGFLFSRR